jgi:type II secretory pathway pseudopilin PulG
MKAADATISRSDRGFVMVALLIGMSVAAIWMAAALPAWRQQTQRQREEDLIFRGEQYARAIVLFQDKNRGALPPSIDVLVSGHYLRKKWKDPITNHDFIPLGAGVGVPGNSQIPSSPGTGQTPARGGQPVSGQTPGRGGPTGSVPSGSQQSQQGQAAGITGVRSESTATSIKIYQNQQQYSLWPFDAAIVRARMGRLPQGQQQPGGNQPGGRQGPGTQGTQPGRGGQQIGPGGAPGRGGGGDRPIPPGPPGGVGPGRAGGSF